jgi:hypothetical protein
MIDVRARDTSGARNGLRFLMRAVSTLLTVLFITSCGSDIILVGTPVITLTAQRGHFTSYIVVIDEIEMTRKDGTVIELPTVSERVDLANLGNFAQLLEAPAVQVGTYVSATFFLDYSAAYVTVDAGGTAGEGVLTDASTGTTPTIDTITVKFDPNNPLVVTNQGSSLVNFNVDLDASNTIDYSRGVLPVPITVHPAFTVTSQPAFTQPVFARGLFVYVNTNKGQFTLNSRPLHDVLDNPFGAVTVQPSATTYYNINGVTYIGAAGLTALQKLESETDLLQVAAVGAPGANPWSDLTGDTPEFTAVSVYAGSSLESTIQDHIVGWVTGIASGNTSVTVTTLDNSTGAMTLTVQNAALVDRLGDYGYSNTTPVVISNETIVSVDGVVPASSPSLTNISVGQLIDVSGVVTLPTDGSSNNPTGLDATTGQVRLQPTSIWGTLNSATAGSGQATITLDWIQDIEPTYTNFAGTGLTTLPDSTVVASYVVSTANATSGPTDLSTSAAGSLFNFVGYANTYGQAPPYFNATSVTPATSLPQRLILEFTTGSYATGANTTGSAQPFSTISGAGLYVNLADAALNTAGTTHVVEVGPQTTEVINGNTYLQIIPSTVAGSQFSVGNTVNGWAIFSVPTDFANEVQYYTGSIGAVQKIVADGQYDPTGTFTATNIEVVIQ